MFRICSEMNMSCLNEHMRDRQGSRNDNFDNQWKICFLDSVMVF